LIFSSVEDDFKSDNDLRIACLMLDQQVKLINGNEANILVPHEWMKKYLEDQERRLQQIESQQPLPPQPSVKRMCIVFSCKPFIFFVLFKISQLRISLHQI
jgi:hypothetical protein